MSYSKEPNELLMRKVYGLDGPQEKKPTLLGHSDLQFSDFILRSQVLRPPVLWNPHRSHLLSCALSLDLCAVSALNTDKPEDVGPAAEPPAAEHTATDAEPGPDSGGYRFG